jgi:hypothetical protein
VKKTIALIAFSALISSAQAQQAVAVPFLTFRGNGVLIECWNPSDLDCIKSVTSLAKAMNKKIQDGEKERRRCLANFPEARCGQPVIINNNVTVEVQPLTPASGT